jgi:cytochrome c553
MYETLEHWKEYQKQKKIEKLENELKQMLKENSIKEMDKLLNKLSVKNGVTKY